ncbi:MAG: hypothetical protein EHM61_00515 [Acidobacteria bacterium]|nr:MAG: hypothetical protein EHM61_00515 [Acidobacteriota bacterium]
MGTCHAGFRDAFNVDPRAFSHQFTPMNFHTEGRLRDSGGQRGVGLEVLRRLLTAEGVDSTLAFISSHSGPGQHLIFDYFSIVDIGSLRTTY